MSSIRMEHIFHSYGEHTVLKDFCMDIQDGEFYQCYRWKRKR